MADEAVRREFQARAPELRAAMVAELSALLDASAAFSEGEAAVLRHLMAYAGYSLSGHLFVPALAALWGEELSYLPSVRLPAEQVRAAVARLSRRGVLVAVTGGVGVSLEGVRAAQAAAVSAPKPLKRPAKSRKPARRRPQPKSKRRPRG
ncbi:MAG: hypothetical protein HY079_10620 [Elusimicrobia bacterium]|nr:hypothetical protein [Elusimicrobiota bacterium]